MTRDRHRASKASQGPGMNRPARSALLVVDMISRFDFPEAPALAASVCTAARATERLVAAFHARGEPVIYANDNFADWKADFAGLLRMAREAGGLAREVAERLRPGSDDYFVLKPKHSAFLATPLPVLLAKLDVGRLYLSGMTADSCVLATAIDANAREYEVHVVREAVAGLARAKRQALQLLADSSAARVVSLETALRTARAR